jgi:hemerythrin-like metal-binding protein
MDLHKKLEYIEWNDKYGVGIKQIDKQHKHFVGIMNKLFEAMQTDKNHAVSKIVEELVAYAKDHFATEEAYFAEFKYPDAEAHIAEHTKIKAKIDIFLAKKDDDPLTLGYNLLDLLENWLFEHILTVDKKYVGFFRQNGIY